MLTALSRRALMTLAGTGSALLLIVAYAFQYIGGLEPCPMCLWQRWPHEAAVAVMLLALSKPSRAMVVLGAIAALTATGLAAYHVGVEQKWWEGLQSCSAGSISGISVDDLLNPKAAVAPPIRCDEVAWSLFGLSMAGWNMLASLALAGLWALAATRD